MSSAVVAPGPDIEFELGATDETLSFLRASLPRYGDFYRVFSRARGAYDFVLNSPDDIKRVMLSNHRNYTKGDGMDRVKVLLGNGIMTSEGELWRRQRRMMQPAFHRRVIDQFVDLIAEVNGRYSAAWARKSAAGEPINLTDETSELTLEIVLRSIFGEDLARIEAERGENPFLVVAREPARDLKFAFRFRQCAKLVTETAERRLRTGEAHVDFLAMLMSARDRETDRGMSERELIDEVLTLIVAGHETTAAALTWTWYLISQNPDADAELHAEAKSKSFALPPTLEAAENLPYTRGVVQESLRLYPPGWLLTRRSIDPDELSGMGIPPRSNVYICPYLLHRHPQHWADPERFEPKRFAAQDTVERHRFAYIPFAVGPRHCIGENMAMFEMLSHMQGMARQFRLSRASSEPIELEAQVNLRPRSPLWMHVHTR